MENPGYNHDGSWILGKGDNKHPVDLRICSPTSAIDIFSLGLAMLSTFQQDRRGMGRMDESGYMTVVEQLASLRDRISEELMDLLRSMLSWKPVEFQWLDFDFGPYQVKPISFTRRCCLHSLFIATGWWL